jgi:hypothetical protein
MAQSSGAAGPSVEDALASLGFALKYIETCERVDSRESAVAQLLEAAGVLQRKAVALGDRSLSGTMNLSDKPVRSSSQNTKPHCQSGGVRNSLRSGAYSNQNNLAPIVDGNETPSPPPASRGNKVASISAGLTAIASKGKPFSRPTPPSVITGHRAPLGSRQVPADVQPKTRRQRSNYDKANKLTGRRVSVVEQHRHIKTQLARHEKEVTNRWVHAHAACILTPPCSVTPVGAAAGPQLQVHGAMGRDHDLRLSLHGAGHAVRGAVQAHHHTHSHSHSASLLPTGH